MGPNGNGLGAVDAPPAFSRHNCQLLPIMGGYCTNERGRSGRGDMTININLPPQLEAMVRQKVASGHYASASEVVREALRLLEHQERLRDAKLERLRRDIDEGLASGEAEPWNADELKREARQKKTAKDGAGGEA
jgi:antitoxin ParD1/3/4